MSTKDYDTIRTKAIAEAYEKLSEDDQIQVDVQVKHILDYYARRNADRRNLAHFSFSRTNALELVASLGLKFSGMQWPAEDETK